MTDREIAAALTAAAEIEKAEFARFLMTELAPLGLAQDDATMRQIVAAFDRFALPEDGHPDTEELV